MKRVTRSRIGSVTVRRRQKERMYGFQFFVTDGALREHEFDFDDYFFKMVLKIRKSFLMIREATERTHGTKA